MIAWSGNHEVSNTELDALVVPHLAESAAWLIRRRSPGKSGGCASRGHLQAVVTVGDPAFHSSDATLPIAIAEECCRASLP